MPELLDEKPRIDKVSLEAERHGICEHCNKTCHRVRTFQATSLELARRLMDDWGLTPLMHARCENRLPGARNSLEDRIEEMREA